MARKSHKWAKSQGPMVQPHSSDRKSCKICGIEHSRNSCRMHLRSEEYDDPYCDTHDTSTGSKSARFARKECSTKHPKGSKKRTKVKKKLRKTSVQRREFMGIYVPKNLI